MEKNLQRAYEQWVSDNDDYKTYEELEELFLDLLNETEIDVLGTSYGAGDILKAMDETAYNEELNNYIDSSWQEIEDVGGVTYARANDDPEQDFYDEMCVECDDCDRYVLDEDATSYGALNLCPECLKIAQELTAQELEGDEEE